MKGPHATEPALSFSRRPRPYRLEVRDTAHRAVANAVAELVAQGFSISSCDVEAKLAHEGSRWTARVVEIGDTRHARRRELLIDAVDVVTVGIGGLFLRRGMEHLTVVVTAKSHDTADTSVLVVAPAHVPAIGDSSVATAGRRYWSAMRNVCAGYDQAGALLSQSSPTRVSDTTCPASLAVAARLLRDTSR